MAIRYGNVGAGALIGGLAKGAGEAIAAQRATELAQRIAEQRQEQEARREDMMIQLQAQKDMKMIDYQMELEKYQRSKEWDIEKMEAASRIDFEKEERAKAAKESEYQLKKKAILDSSVLTKQQKDKLAVALDMEYLGAGGLAQQFMKPKTMEEIAVEREEARQGTAGAAGTTEGVGIGNKELAVIGKDLIAFDLDKGTQVPIEDTKIYSVTDTTGQTRKVIGSELKKGWDTDILAFHGEAAPSQPTHPKAQEEMQKKFMGDSFVQTTKSMKPTEPQTSLRAAIQPNWRIEQAYKGYLKKAGMTKETLSWEQYRQQYIETGTWPLTPQEIKEQEKERREREAFLSKQNSAYGQFGYLRERFPNY